MNFSTNQVMQLFVLGSTDTAKVEAIKTSDGNEVKGYIVKVKNSAGDVIDTTDIIDAKNILYVTEALASKDKLNRKGLLVKLNSAVNGGKPVKGEEYVMTLVYRGFGEEDTYSKVFSAKATSDDTATLLKDLAKNMLTNIDVEYSPLYELYTTEGVKITMANYETAVTAEGFYIVEPVPYWSLGRFAETLMHIDVQTAYITIDGEEEQNWLAEYKFKPVTLDGVASIPNTHKIADLEYFCKGERGTSNALVGWPDTPDYKGKVNPDSANGYDVLTVHCAFVGANASNQKSEKDIIFITEGGTASLNTKLDDIKTGLNV
jgi:hypothetical protein